MKRVLSVLLAILMIGAVLCACGKKDEKKENVSMTVSSKYDDGFAKKFATSTANDKNGTTYEFTGEEYERYTEQHNNVVSKDAMNALASRHSTKDEKGPYGEYVYMKEDKNAVIVGVHTEAYNEDTAKAESKELAEYGFMYFQNLKEPVSTISVIYCDCNNQNTVFGTFEYTAE